MAEDGGYYAIKGFEYQIDKSIIDMFTANDENEPIHIEKIQDISTNQYVTQVKYKETQDYSPSKIRKPVIQLIEECKKDPNKTYYLFCYFKNKPECEKRLKISDLDVILGIEKDNFTNSDKALFVDRFILSFSECYQVQFETVLEYIQSLSYCSDKEESIFLYSVITNYIRKIIINNTDINNRSFSRKEVLSEISNCKKIIFESSYLHYKGKRDYIAHIKRKIQKLNRAKHNYIFIGDIEYNSSMTVGSLIISILEKYYANAQSDIQPLTVIINDKYIHNVKKELIDQDHIFNDGYESIKFNENIFFSKHIINKKTTPRGFATCSLDKISFELRLISRETFNRISTITIPPYMAYYFNERPAQENSLNHIIIDDLTSTEILSVII